MDVKLRKTADILNGGGVVVVPTDTVCGIAAVVGNREGVKRIYKIKRRKNDKPLAILIPTIDDVWQWVDKTPELEGLCRGYWPGANTLILNDKQGNSIGLRMPDCSPLIEIMGLTGPLYATSANIAGEPAPSIVEEIADSIRDSVDLVSDIKVRPIGKPSKILDLRNERVSVLRP